MRQCEEQFLRSIVTADGRLDETKILDQQTVYVGPNGRAVIRFAVIIEGEVKRFILKPSSYAATAGRDAWMEQHLMPWLNGVRVPKMYASASPEQSHSKWCILEDVGPISHQFSPEDMMEAMRLIPVWHSLDAERMDKSFTQFGGITPEVMLPIATEIGHSDRLEQSVESEVVVGIRRLLQWIPLHAGAMFGPRIVSHGDYHVGNIGIRTDGLVVLDWESAHLDVAYCDIYALLDKTHPEFDRPTMTNDFRTRAIEEYIKARWPDEYPAEPQLFIRTYFFYAIISSLWMLSLVWHDLDAGRWNSTKLLAQEQSIVRGLNDFVRFLRENGGGPG